MKTVFDEKIDKATLNFEMQRKTVIRNAVNCYDFDLSTLIKSVGDLARCAHKLQCLYAQSDRELK